MAEWLVHHSGRVAEWLSGWSSHSGRVAEWLSGWSSHSGRVAEWLSGWKKPEINIKPHSKNYPDLRKIRSG